MRGDVTPGSPAPSPSPEVLARERGWAQGRRHGPSLFPPIPTPVRATQPGPGGVSFGTALVGTWEPDGEPRGDVTAVQLLSDAAGAFTGMVTIDGFPEVSADGQSFFDDNSRSIVTVRDASGPIINQILPTGSPAGPGVPALRMGGGLPGFP